MGAASTVGGGEPDPFAVISEELRAVLTRDGVVRELSAAWGRVLGRGPASLQGRALATVVHVDDREVLARVLRELVPGQPVGGVELRLTRPDAPARWVRCSLLLSEAPAGDAGAEVVRLVAVDVTDRRQDRAARELVEQVTGVGSWEIDVGSGRIVWSQVTHRLHGSDPTTREGSVELSLTRYPPHARTQVQAAFERLLATGEPYDLEVDFLAPDGSPRVVRTAGRAVLRDGVVVRVHGTLGDVTDQVLRKRERDELARTKALLEESQRLARIGHWQVDLDTGRLRWSPVVYEIFGLDPDRYHLDRATIRDLLHPDDVATVDALEPATRATGSHEVDFRVRRPDGTERVIHQLGRLEPDPDTGRPRVIGTVQDVTQLRRAERLLRESEAVLQRVLAATNDGWWEIDLGADGGSFYSERWWALCGYRPGELPDEPEPWRQLTHPDDLVRFEAEFTAVLASDATSFTLPSAGLHRDGRRIPMLVRGLIERAGDGTPLRISGTTSDVTAARQAELVKEEFISTVSHELRTPLTAIGGAIELLTEGVAGELPATALQLVELAQRNTRRLGVLIDDLLDLERLLTDRQRFEHVTQPLESLLVEALDELCPLATHNGVSFLLSGPPEPVVVHVDGPRIQQVLANYLSNAAKYAPDGSIVEVRVRPSPEGTGRVRVEVVDRGPGVPPGLVGRLFERFVQGDPTDPRSRGGTGLGLAISREIIERHGGTVGVDTQPGRTCFWFDLPLASVVTPSPDEQRTAGPD